MIGIGMHVYKLDQALALKKRLNQLGNTVVEYALIGVSLLALSFAGLNLMGGNLNSLFLLMNTDMNQHMQNASTVNAQHASAKLGFQAAASSQTKTVPAANPITPTIPAPPFTGNGAGPVTQTVGANGTTETYAQNITDQAAQSLANGEISEADYNLVVKLANKGHEIAQIQGMLEQAMTASNGNTSTYAAMTFPFQGQNYTAAQLATLVTTSNADFQAIQLAAEQKVGIVGSPALLGIIQVSGGQILMNGANIANMTQSVDKAVYTSQQLDNSGQSVSSTSVGTHAESGTICNGGQATDSGTNCHP